jgi:preprotein translocase subunit SecG
LLSYLLYGLFILACVVLVVTVLLQPGKADAGALFSSSVSSTAFGPRGTQSILSKITIGAAAAFMLLALTLSLPAITGTRSVLQSAGPEAEPSPAQQPTPAPSQAPAENASPAASPAASAAPASAAPSPSTQK